MNKKIKEKAKLNSAITLIALIITIIVLLILAGITLNMVIGENGIIKKAIIAKEKNENAQEQEKGILSQYENKINEYIVGNRGNNNTSSIIKNVTFSVNTFSSSIKVNINVDVEDMNNIIGYHIFVINVNEENKIETSVTEDKEVEISNLTPNTKYKVFVVAYDIQNNCKSSEIKEITTLNEPEKLIPALTSNTSAGGVAFATNTANGKSPWEAFDGNIPPNAYSSTVGYMVSSTTTNQIGYDFGEGNSKIVSKLVYYGHPKDPNVRYSEITLQYSDNGSDWTDVETFYPRIISSYTEISDLAQEFKVSSLQDKHRYWRINGTNAGYGWSGLLELEFWGF